MTGGIVTLLSLLGFLAVVIYVYIIKRREDFDEQAGLPLEDAPENRDDRKRESRENHS